MSYCWVEPFAGAAAVALRLVGGRSLAPPVAYMGGKRRYARQIADAMGVPDGRPSQVLLSDPGPWGWVWPLLFDADEAAKVAHVLRWWQGEHPRDLWQRLAAEPPFDNVHELAAQWLWLQARSASGVPIWWDGWRLVGGNGKTVADRGEDLRWRQADHDTGRSQRATQTGGGWEQASGEGRAPQPLGQRGEWRFGARPCDAQKSRTAGGAGMSSGRTSGMVNPSTIADRIEAIARAFRPLGAQVCHGEASEIKPRPAFCYLDPPYVGATGYGWDCPRAEVERLAQAWADAGAVVAVSESEPIKLAGWHELELTRESGKPEWLTISRKPAAVSRQLDMFAGRSP